jgi:hypothetical protein
MRDRSNRPQREILFNREEAKRRTIGKPLIVIGRKGLRKYKVIRNERKSTMEDLINQYVEVKADEKGKTLSVKFLAFVPLQEFIRIVDHEFKLVKHHQLKKCIIDLRLIPVYDKGMPEYVKDVWFPTAISLGVKCAAFVVPEAVLGQMTMSKAHENVEEIPALEVNHFKDVESAMEWLNSR